MNTNLAEKNRGEDLEDWNTLDNRRQSCLFSLRLTRRQKAQLDYIAANAKTRSTHAWLISVLAPVLDAESSRIKNA